MDPVHEQVVIASSPDAMVLLDAGGKVLDWSDAARALFGYSREDAVGHPLKALIVAENQWHEADELLQDAAAAPRVDESVRHRKDGTRLHVSTSVVKLQDAPLAGGYLLGMRDVTPLKLLREVKALEARYRGLLDHTGRHADHRRDRAHRARQHAGA